MWGSDSVFKIATSELWKTHDQRWFSASIQKYVRCNSVLCVWRTCVFKS